MTDAPTPLGRRDRWSLRHVEPLPSAQLFEPDRDSVAVAFQGVLTHRPPGSDGPEPLAVAAALLDLLRTTPTTESVHAFAGRLLDLDGPMAMDRFLEATRVAGGPDRTRLAAMARWLCTQGVHHEQVQAGLALLGISGGAEDEPLTLHALVALQNLLPEPEQAMFDLARRVEGWGRIHALYRLKDSTDPAIGRWMLYEGWRTGVMTEEVAFVVATTGGLARALDTDDDEALLDAAGALLQALAVGGPAEDMSDYADGQAAMASYFDRMLAATPSLLRLGHVVGLERYLRQWAKDNERLSDDDRSTLLTQVRAVLRRPEWRSVADAALHSHDLGQVRLSLSLVGRFGLDPTPVVRAWLPQAPEDAYLWQFLLRRADLEEMRSLLLLAEGLLHLEDLPQGPALEHGLGPGYERNGWLMLTLQALQAFPREGTRVVLLGLNSPVVSTRNFALRTLEAWPAESRTGELTRVLEQMAWRDPAEKLRRRARALVQ